MCELLAMSARFPTTIHLSMTELARHGGGTGPHRDGWGVGFVHQNDAIVVREPAAASTSDWLAFVQQADPQSEIVIAHVRRATLGSRLVRNTQPFARELAGRMHLFAHNGMMHDIATLPRFATRRFRAIGDTDSEHAFCGLLERLAPLWDADEPSLDARLAVIAEFAAELRQLGPANFIYTDGDALFVHGHRRMNESGRIEPPGVHLLCRRCSAPSDNVERGDQQVTLVASVPLSDEAWQPLAEGELVVLRRGEIARRVRA